MHFPSWLDLKGQDSVPETVHHVVSIFDNVAVDLILNESIGGIRSITNLNVGKLLNDGLRR